MKIPDYIEITNEDNMELMARYPDNHFDLAIVDPPYGIGISLNPVRQKYKKKNWDNETPSELYFNQVQNKAKNVIIWGGNYFLDFLGSSQCIIIWDKKQPVNFSLAMCEIAWTNFNKPAKIFRESVLKERGKIHPTQKPVALYVWLLQNYAKPGDKILDTHLGSGSIAIAIDQVNKIEGMNLTLTACELDKDYYESAIKRISEQTKWQPTFKPEPIEPEQTELF